MRRSFASDVVRALVAQSTQVDPVQKMLPGAKQNGSDGEMQLIDERGLQELPDRGYSATKANVASTCSVCRLLKS